MKRLASILLILAILTGCSSGRQTMERVLALRSALNVHGCRFVADITADYGDSLYTFSLDCSFDPQGKLTFSVLAPESISGISGTVSAGGGELHFDDTVLAFALLADGQFSPISGPWVMMKALLSGYITSCGTEGGQLRATIRDSYAEDALTVDLWLDQENIPLRGEICWNNHRILTIAVKNFTMP